MSGRSSAFRELRPKSQRDRPPSSPRDEPPKRARHQMHQSRPSQVLRMSSLGPEAWNPLHDAADEDDPTMSQHIDASSSPTSVKNRRQPYDHVDRSGPGLDTALVKSARRESGEGAREGPVTPDESPDNENGGEEEENDEEAGDAQDGNQVEEMLVEHEDARADVGSVFVSSAFVSAGREFRPGHQPRNRVRKVHVKSQRGAVGIGSYAFGMPTGQHISDGA